MNMEKVERCRCPHHLAIPLSIVALAIVLLLGNLEVISQHVSGILWPIILGLIGVQKALERRCRCCDSRCHCHEHEGHTHSH